MASLLPVSSSELLRVTGVTTTLTLGGNAALRAVATSCARAVARAMVSMLAASAVGGASSCLSNPATSSKIFSGAETTSELVAICGVMTTRSLAESAFVNIERSTSAVSFATPLRSTKSSMRRSLPASGWSSCATSSRTIAKSVSSAETTIALPSGEPMMLTPEDSSPWPRARSAKNWRRLFAARSARAWLRAMASTRRSLPAGEVSSSLM